MQKKTNDIFRDDYLAAVARIQALEDEAKRNNEYWSKYRAENDVTIKLCRELCSMILAKDPSEMQTGKNVDQWASRDIKTLIRDAKRVFTNYNHQRTEQMRALLKENEVRGAKIEGLVLQFEQAQHEGATMTANEALRRAEETKAMQNAYDLAPAAIKEAADQGSVKFIVGDKGDVEAAELQALEEAMSEGIQEKLTATSIPTTDRGQTMHTVTKKAVEKASAIPKQNGKPESHIVDLQAYANDCKGPEWGVLSAIGNFGISKSTDVTEKAQEIASCSTSNSRSALSKLGTMRAICREEVIIFNGKLSILHLTDVGRRLFMMHFGKPPCVTEADKIRAEHDNLEHGYGIVAVAKIMEDSGKYAQVESYNRNSPIEVDINGKTYKYIPDIKAKPKGAKYTEYWEYERGHHTQIDFNAKCDKMCRVTRFLNFVAPNKDTALRLKDQVDAWAKERPQDVLKNITLSIYTTTNIQDGAESMILYRFKNSLEAVRVS